MLLFFAAFTNTDFHRFCLTSFFHNCHRTGQQINWSLRKCLVTAAIRFQAGCCSCAECWRVVDYKPDWK